jgi:hypothetical protein
MVGVDSFGENVTLDQGVMDGMVHGHLFDSVTLIGTNVFSS